jgi:hypothetical protein
MRGRGRRRRRDDVTANELCGAGYYQLSVQTYLFVPDNGSGAWVQGNVTTPALAAHEFLAHCRRRRVQSGEAHSGTAKSPRFRPNAPAYVRYASCLRGVMRLSSNRFVLLSSLVATATAAASACGGRTVGAPGEGSHGADAGIGSTSSSGSSGGPASSSSGSGGPQGSSSSSGGPPSCETSTVSYPVDTSTCWPQIESESSMAGTGTCMATIEVPCPGDVGFDASDPCAPCVTLTGLGATGICSVEPFTDEDAGVKGTRIVCGYCCIGGRCPRGFRPLRGERLAQMAQVEAASVDAFHALNDDLARLGAPGYLLRAVRAAAKDEVRHARAVGRTAERLGAHVPRAQVQPIAPRSLEQLAVENAEEGCVLETIGAAVAAMQAEHARDAGVRRVMRAIARDELRHAALAWRIADWLDARLDAAARARVREARGAALERMRAAMAAEGAGDPVLGFPAATASVALVDHLWDALATGDMTVARAA